jgi:hypothetical protein
VEKQQSKSKKEAEYPEIDKNKPAIQHKTEKLEEKVKVEKQQSKSKKEAEYPKPKQEHQQEKQKPNT